MSPLHYLNVIVKEVEVLFEVDVGLTLSYMVDVPRRRHGNPVVENVILQGLQQIVQQLVGIVVR